MRTPYALALLAVAALPVAAQQPTRTLAKPLAEHSEPFSQIAAIRELKDGRLLVVDSRDKLVQLVDLTAKTATKVGREGSGPGEYGLPTQLFALPGDSSVIFDPLNQRYLMVHPDGKPGASFRVGDEPSAPPRPPQGQRPGRNAQTRKPLPGDDRPVEGVVQGGCAHGPPLQPITGKGGVHRQHMLHEVEIRAVVGDVVKSDKAHEQGPRGQQGNLGETFNHGRVAVGVLVALQNSPVQAVAGSKLPRSTPSFLSVSN